MTKDDIKKRIKKLKEEINYHRYLYHVLDKIKISDAALDSLKNVLFKSEQEYPEFVTPDSPTQRVGGKPLGKFEKIQHSKPMMSLFDAFSCDDMKDWEKRMSRIMPDGKFDYFCELKLDGLAANLRYNRGKFTQGATRGNGLIGEDVTQNLKTIEAIPLTLRFPKDEEFARMGLPQESIKKINTALKKGIIEVRGEVIMANKVFFELNKKYKKQGKPELSNPRNAAAGSIRQLNSKIAAERNLDYYTYDLATDFGLKLQEQKLLLAKLLGFKISRYNKYCKNLEEVIKFHNYWEDHKGKLPFNCDGVAVKINRLALWPILGVVGKGPRYMIAFKFSAEQAATKIINVIWQVGRTGVLTPIAELDPVNVGGAVISHATLHNMDEIQRLAIKIGDTVIIERAGDVIPKIVKVLPKLRDGREKNILMPIICPVCGGGVIKKDGEVAYRCGNKNCYAVNLRKLIHWASKGAMDIEGLGPKVIEQLVKDGLVQDVSDFYNLTSGDLKPLERFADRSAENLIQAINHKKKISLSKLIYGLGIRHVGEETAQLLSKLISNSKFLISNDFTLTISQIIRIFQKLTLEDLEKIGDIGPVVAESIYGWFHNERNLGLLAKLEKNGILIKAEQTDAEQQVFNNKSFVLTGALENLTRDKAKDRIRILGGNISTSVSKNTDFVVAGAEPGSKYDKAKKLGVKIINEEEFLKMI